MTGVPRIVTHHNEVVMATWRSCYVYSSRIHFIPLSKSQDKQKECWHTRVLSVFQTWRNQWLPFAQDSSIYSHVLFPHKFPGILCNTVFLQLPGGLQTKSNQAVHEATRSVDKLDKLTKPSIPHSLTVKKPSKSLSGNRCLGNQVRGLSEVANLAPLIGKHVS